MEIIHINGKIEYPFLPSVVALGYFDGMHLGHLALIEEVGRIAKTMGLKKSLLTFSMQPKSFLSHKEEHYLTSLEDKIELARNLGIDYFIVLEFNETIRDMEPEDFISNYLIEMKFAHLVCGFDYRFGRFGKGTSQTLQEYDSNFGVSVIAKMNYHEHKIATRYIKNLLKQGDIEAANLLLDRPFKISGMVIHGRELGRTIGFPTANIDYGNYLLPKNGVYAVKITVSGEKYLGMGNIGFNPTIGILNIPSLEVNIFNFNQDIYDTIVDVEFIKYIREEKKFSSLDELVRQLRQDRETIDKGEW